jgi:hypothetical protein
MIERAILSVLVAAVCGAALATGLAPVRANPRACVEQAGFNRTGDVAALVHDARLAQDMAERSREVGRRCVW